MHEESGFDDGAASSAKGGSLTHAEIGDVTRLVHKANARDLETIICQCAKRLRTGTDG